MAARRIAALATAGGTCYALSSAAAVRRESRHQPAISLEAALPLVDTVGYAVVADCVPDEKLCRCRETEAFRTMPTRHAHSIPRWRQSAHGRFHRVQFDPRDAKVFEELESAFAPLVEAYFGDELEGVYRSELQLLTAAPRVSANQMWHSDNQARGVTVVVPLCDFTAENGATQLLPGSHTLASSWPLLLSDGARVVTPRLGSIGVYDARTYHRGLGNSTGDSRPALVFRYDRAETPPPGVSAASSIRHALTAASLHVGSAVGIALREAAFG